MICSENDLRMRAQEYFQNESYVPRLFIRKFSPIGFKCVKEVVVANWDD